MPRVDERVRAAVAVGENTPVIVVCGDNCASVAKAMRDMSLSVNEGAIEMGSLFVVVGANELRAIEAIDGVDSIELDEEVSTL